MTDRPGANSCDLCRAQGRRSVGRVTREREAFDLVACEGCGLIRRDPIPSAQELERLYQTDYWLEFGVPDPRSPGFVANKQRKARHRIAFLEEQKLMPAPGRLLEIGCAEGQFVKEMLQRGWRISGIEPDPALAKMVANDTGAVIAAGMFPGDMPPGSGPTESGPDGAGPFDMIAAFHVIEHARSPREMLEAARAMLAPGGLLYIAVPDAGAPGLTLEHPIFRACHLYSFTTETLGAMLKSCGLSPMWIGPSDVCGKPELKSVASV